MTVSFGVLFNRATILRASSNGQACDCSASSRKFAGFSITAVDIPYTFRALSAAHQKALASKRVDREIAQPQVGEAALLPLPEQRPVQGLPQQIVAALNRDADALAEEAALQERAAAEGATAAGVGAVEPEGERDAVAEQQIDVAVA